MARPSEFTAEIAERICEAIATTPRGLDFICAQHDDLPSPRTVARWLTQYDEFRQQYAHARERQADMLVGEALEIADTPVIGEKRKDDGETVEITTGDMIEHRRLQVDVRKWTAARLAPRKYGDRQTLEHTDPNGGSPLATLMEAIASNGRPRP